jgi:hypothetical protein
MTVGAILGGIIAFLKAIPILDGWFQQLLALYITSQDQATQSKLVDAAALGAKAQTDADRFAAAEAWQTALKRTRVIS